MDSATIESCVRRHHIYKANSSPFKGEKLVCCQEKNNSHDPYAVVVIKGKMIVGHVPRKISATRSLFFDKEDTTSLVQSQENDAILLICLKEDLKFHVYYIFKEE